MTGSFGITGYLVLAVYLIATVLLGLSFARKQKDLADYFLAERSAPWWAVAISVLACDMSAISYMGAPAYTYHHDLRLPISIFLWPLIAWLVAFLFIPFLARLNVYTIYEYLEHRFNLSSRLFASAVFALQRAMHIAIAIYAVSLALQQIINWPVWACASLIGATTTLYTVFGGMKAVLWTDVMQFFVLMGGIFAMLGVIMWQFDGDVLYIWRVAQNNGRTRMFDWNSNIFSPEFWMELTVWGVFLGTVATNVAMYGSDQVIVQRYISAGSGEMMSRSLIVASIISIPVTLLLYFLGFAFLAYYHAPGNAALLSSLDGLIETTGSSNMIMPHFVRNVLPSGLAGLVFASLFAATMSVFSSGLNSLSTVTCVDFIERMKRSPSGSQEITLASARWVTFAWGLLVTVAAVGVDFAKMGSILEVAMAVIGFFSGPLLGMFLLGMFSMRANSLGVILGALCGFAVALALWSHVSFIWFAVTGFVPTVVFGFVLSYLTPPEPEEKVYPMTIWGRYA